MQDDGPKGEIRKVESKSKAHREASDKAVWELAFKIEERLKQHRINIIEEWKRGEDGKPDVRNFFLAQRHGPFKTRGEALALGLDLLDSLLHR